MPILPAAFYDRDACTVARGLLGKVIRHKVNNLWLSAQIIETEAYYKQEKGSHSSLGYTQKRKAMFMPAGTIYMYYARGKDSLNISVKGAGNAVLIKSAIPYIDRVSPASTLKLMHRHNPKADGKQRQQNKLCSGQTLLCRTLGLRVCDWDQQQFSKHRFYIDDINYRPEQIIQTTRLGIPAHRDADLPYRFVDAKHAAFCTQNPLTRRQANYRYVKA